MGHEDLRPPAHRATNGWYNILPAPPPARRVEGTVRVPWAVVGAGFTGLAAARTLAGHLPDQTIALIEAERVGFGTSGRNSGFVLDSHFMPHRLPFPDPELAMAATRLCTGGRDILKRLVVRHRIDCDWRDWGKLWIAASPAGEEGLLRQRQGNDALGIGHEIIDRDKVEAITGTRFYSAGLKVEGTALVNPAALCRGLAEILPANVALHENSPVLAHQKGSPHRLVTPSGEVVADSVILCTNVYSPSLGVARQAMAPLVLYASLTRPMTSDETEAAGGDRRGFGLLPAARGGSTIQRTTDGRLLVRNTLAYGPAAVSEPAKLERARVFHVDSIRKRWPAIAAIDIEHTWGGCVGITRNEGHIFGAIGDRLWASIACNGAGISRGTMAGSLLADLVVGRESDLLNDQRRIPAPGWMPPEPLRGLISRGHIRQHKADLVER